MEEKQKEIIIAKKESIIAQQDNTLSSLQNQLEEYRRRYGKLNNASN